MALISDSPLSITASIAGILTFVFAIAASLYLRFTYLANADNEYFRVKASLSWYKTESQWLEELIRATPRSPVPVESEWEGDSGSGSGRNGQLRTNGVGPLPGLGGHGVSSTTAALLQHQIYVFTTDQLHQLEARLLELLTEAEVRAAAQAGDGRGWTLVGGGRTGIAVAWLRVRARALELVRQRDALGGRVLFVQLSAVERRLAECRREVRDGERKLARRVEKLEELLRGKGPGKYGLRIGDEEEDLDKSDYVFGSGNTPRQAVAVAGRVGVGDEWYG